MGELRRCVVGTPEDWSALMGDEPVALPIPDDTAWDDLVRVHVAGAPEASVKARVSQVLWRRGVRMGRLRRVG